MALQKFKNTEYLGDSVYAQQNDAGTVVLTTSCHAGSELERPDNEIYIEDDVLANLRRWLARIEEERNA